MKRANNSSSLTRSIIVFDLALLLLAISAFPDRAMAQSQVDQLESLSVELWPDYDRPSVLVLLQGSLTPDTPLPATVAIPLPTDAELHVVARLTANNELLTDVDYRVDGDQLLITLPDSSFRVEYYMPYQSNGDQRDFRFEWRARLGVRQLSAAIQQPAAAENLTINPPAVNVANDHGDGLAYHTLASVLVPAGQPYVINVSYQLPSGALSAPEAEAAKATQTGSQIGYGLNVNPWWLAAVVGVVAVLAGAWYLWRRQSGGSSGRTRKPAPNRSPKPQPKAPTTDAATARYCHNCGRKAEASDEFCRQCGTPLKPVG